MTPRWRVPVLGGAVWIVGLYPLGRLAWWLRDGLLGLGANPIERILHHTGWWALVLLLVTLAITPLRRITGRNRLIRARRPLGLFAFFYATLHFGIYLVLDQGVAWAFILEDIAERPFITVGLLAWVLLAPLALTSTRGWIRRLGRRWTLLHRLVYVSTVLGIVHFYWRVKADTRLPLLFAAAFVALMLLRMSWTRGEMKRPRRREPDGALQGSGGPRGGAGSEG